MFCSMLVLFYKYLHQAHAVQIRLVTNEYMK